MKLGKPEPLGIVYNHCSGLRNVHADLYYRRRHKTVVSPALELRHNFVFLFVLHSAVHKGYAHTRQFAFELFVQFGYGHNRPLLVALYLGADEVRFVAQLSLFGDVPVHIRVFAFGYNRRGNFLP